jgi:NAD(P)-dependent dehydrogenase (short-subunit alcohol dehydrogenase family)
VDTFRDKTAIVTGGASGIGRALCEELGRRGALVIVADINGEGADQVAAAINDSGNRAAGVQLDVSCAAEVEKGVQDAAAKYGRLDYMFNNAAVCVVGELRDSIPDHWRRIIEVNLFGVIYGTMAAYSVMISQGSGHIINVASVTGLMPTPILTHYGTTKWGVIGFSTSLRPEAATLGVKVSVACPSLVRTNIPDRTIYLNLHKEEYLARLPWRWMMDPGEAATAILRGVARNRAMIVCPFHGRVLWWCYRLCPSLLTPLSTWTVREFRKLRLS